MFSQALKKDLQECKIIELKSHIEELRAKIKFLRNRYEWHPVSDKPPQEKKVRLLVNGEEIHGHFAGLKYYSDNGYDIIQPTHWQQLNTPEPEESED